MTYVCSRAWSVLAISHFRLRIPFLKNMKLLIALALSFSATAAMAAEPAYTCEPERGCREEQGPSYDIGRGAMLSLPAGWRIFSYPTAPDPIMAGLREIRAVKNGMVIAISPIPNVDKRVITADQLCGLVSTAGEKYVKQSKEQTVTPVPISHGAMVGCHVSFTAAAQSEKPFAVLPNRHHASVTTFLIASHDVIFSVSAVSERLPDADFQMALKAIEQVR